MNKKISTGDRNAMTLTLSVLVLTVIILGITFTYEKPDDKLIHSMDVILSNKANIKAPDEAEYLSQNNQLGGGDSEKKSRPQDIMSATSPIEDGNAPVVSQKSIRDKQSQPITQVVTSRKSSQKVKNKDKTKEKKDKSSKQSKDTETLRMAKIEDEIAKKIEQYAKKPKSKYLSSSSKAYEYAPYISNWVRKIERTGDLNYPEEAKKKEFTGNVMLTVGVKKDGSIHEIKVVKTSGFKFLDEAAIHIVELSKPFEALPETAEGIDILYITRTWQFLPGHLLRHK